MQHFRADNIEQQMHDSIKAKSIERSDRLVRLLSENLHVSEERLKDDKTIAAELVKLQNENDPVLQQYDEDLWIFLAEHLDDAPGENTYRRAAGKNSFYNRAKAKAYIDTYWNNYNPAYPEFHGGGGDCANFISQVVHAGGMPWIDDGVPEHYTWFTNWYCKPGATNRDGDRRITLSWKIAEAFKRHWVPRAARSSVITYKDAINSMKELSRQIYIGDPVQFCYANGVAWHTLVVTGFVWDDEAGVPDIVLASHTINSNRRSLYNTMLKYPQDYQLRLYVIKEGE